MELSPLSFPGSAIGSLSSLQPLRGQNGLGKPSEQEQLRESCRQFEAILWRTVLTNTKSNSLNEEAESSDPTGTYQYFFNDSIANSVSGSPSGFADTLYQQLSRYLHQNQPTPSENA